LIPGGVRGDYALTSRHSDLNEEAARIGWRDAIMEHTRQHSGPEGATYAREYICSEARADFRFLMPINEQSVVLDLGSGWGNVTTAFARLVDRVVAMDTNLDNLQFVRLRARQEGLHNVVTVQGDAYTLPAMRESFDAVLMVGVLEWVAWGRDDADPRMVQREALLRAFRSLKPGGVLYLAIENRFSLKYFFGIREPHTRLRFISLMPMTLARLYSRRVRGKDYVETTYSYSGLSRLLRSVGFERQKFWFPVPGYQNFRYLIDLDDVSGARYVAEQLPTYSSASRIAVLGGAALRHMPLGLAKTLWPSFAVVATRS
jgi:ubiquinone/menaquinone biosynthesis C-methylase UbiE